MWIMAVMDGAIANVALPTIAQDLHASPAFSIWIVNGYQPAITISLLPPAAEAHSNSWRDSLPKEGICRVLPRQTQKYSARC